MADNIIALQTWILSKHLALGWTPKGAWVGQQAFKQRLLADAGKPAGTSGDAIRRAVNDLLGYGIAIGSMEDVTLRF